MSADGSSRRLELKLLEELAAGTFAKVYLAEARGSGGVERLVAVKVLREKWSDSEDILARTRDEARLLARLRHKNIVKVEELTDLDGQPAIIMEFIEGLNLQQLVDNLRTTGRAFPAKASIQLGVATASALDAAWRRAPYGLAEPLRVVHRDVKPSNIMVGPDGEVKVLDFGTARSSSPLRSAKTGMVRFGSWKYMSPERKEGERGEHPGDVYALGLLLVEVMSQDWLPVLPVGPEDHDRVIGEHLDALGDIGMPNQAWADAFKDLLRQVTAYEPDARPTAEQLVEVLRQYGDHARGQTLDALAAEMVQPQATESWRNRLQGSLSGTRLTVSLDGSAPPVAKRPEGEQHRVLHPEDGQNEPEEVTAPAPPAWQPPPQAAPEPEAPAWQPPPQAAPEPQAPAWQPPPQAAAAPPPPHQEPPHPASDPDITGPIHEPAPRSGGSRWILLALVGFGGFLAMSTVGIVALLFFLGDREFASPPDPQGPVPVAASADRVNVKVSADDPKVQWLAVADGGDRHKDRGQVNIDLPSGVYRLSVKVVGWPAAEGDLELGDADVTITCDPIKDGDGKVACTRDGEVEPLVLVP